MPTAAPRPCRAPGCPELVTGSGSFCPEHSAERARQDAARRGSPSKRGYGRRWRKLRQMYLSRHPLCVDPFGLHGDEPPAADVVDHIIPKSAGGTDAYDNLQALCYSCHNRKTLAEQGEPLALRPGQARIPTTVVAGPPGGGKTTWVGDQRQWGDLVLDVDALYHALSGGLPWYDKPQPLLPFVLAARDATIRRLAYASNVRHAWIITGDSDQGGVEQLAQDLGAALVIIEATPLECMRRIAADERRRDRAAHWQQIVDRWFDRWGKA